MGLQVILNLELLLFYKFMWHNIRMNLFWNKTIMNPHVWFNYWMWVNLSGKLVCNFCMDFLGLSFFIFLFVFFLFVFFLLFVCLFVCVFLSFFLSFFIYLFLFVQSKGVFMSHMDWHLLIYIVHVKHFAPR